MARKVKCPYCEVYFLREEEESVQHKNRWYHKDCYDAFWEVESSRLELINFILPLFEIKAPGPKIYNQIKKYVAEFDYTYVGILNALKYFYEVRGNSTEKSNSGIGIVPHVYDEAQKHFNRKIEKVNRVMAQIDNYKKTIDDDKTHIVVNKDKILNRKIKPNREIDIDSL